MTIMNENTNSTPVASGSDPAHIVDRLLDALASRDVNAVDACYAPDVVIWHNANNQAEDREQNLQGLAAILPQWSDLSYDEIWRVDIPGGVAQRHRLRGRGPDGAEFEVRIALFVTLDSDGRILRVDEYLDPSQLPPMG